MPTRIANLNWDEINQRELPTNRLARQIREAAARMQEEQRVALEVTQRMRQVLDQGIVEQAQAVLGTGQGNWIDEDIRMQPITIRRVPQPAQINTDGLYTATTFQGRFYNDFEYKPYKHMEKVPDDHPINFLNKLSKELGITAFKFAAYEYRETFDGQYPTTMRETSTIIKADNLTENFLEYIKDKPGDVAVQSSVWIGKDMYHMSLIDFKCDNLKLIKEAIDGSSDSLGMDSDDFELYHSGASYHAYGKLLLSETEAIPDYSSRLLLVAHPTAKDDIVDSRWVGHSQLKGDFSLRLTNNKKPQLPKLVK